MKIFFALFAAIIGNHVTSVVATVGGNRKMFLDYPIYDVEPEYCNLQECFDGDGFFHTFLRTSADGTPIKSFNQALAATPPLCVLAPVNSQNDVLAARSAIFDVLPQDDANFAYVGVYKDLADYQPGVQSRTDWNNVDGSIVPTGQDLWSNGNDSNGEPNAGGIGANPPGAAELYGIVGFGNLMADFNGSGNSIQGAVYKCCYEENVLCEADETGD